MCEIIESEPGVYKKYLDFKSLMGVLRHHGFDKPPAELTEDELSILGEKLSKSAKIEASIVRDNPEVYPCWVATNALEKVREEIERRKG